LPAIVIAGTERSATTIPVAFTCAAKLLFDRDFLRAAVGALSSSAMSNFAQRAVRWWAGPGTTGSTGHVVSRWLFLRALGAIYFSAFYSLVFQIRALLGPTGLLPAGSYLQEVAKVMPGAARFWYAPTLLWFNSNSHALTALCWLGVLASVLLILNIWPRAMLVLCFVLFLSFVAAAEDFSGYQSDGMLLAAGFICFFMAPDGLRPGLGEKQPPSRATLFLLQLLWFSIYFESGIAKYFGGDPSWRDFSAMNEYYQNGPLPTWIGWYAAQLPRAFHETTAFVMVFTELAVVGMVFLPRAFRIICFFFVTFLQVVIILTANYAFLNYLVLALGIFLLDDVFLIEMVPRRWRGSLSKKLNIELREKSWSKDWFKFRRPVLATPEAPEPDSLSLLDPARDRREEIASTAQQDIAQDQRNSWWRIFSDLDLGVRALVLAWVLYATLFLLVQQISPGLPLPSRPMTALEPFRVANSYGLFGRMTWARYEIEFQGSNDGVNWTTYPFRYKPQALNEAPGIYAPHQPRFEWNLWFASLGGWRENPFVVRTEQQLLFNNGDVLSLFRFNPFTGTPPTYVRAVIWQYWFTDRATKKSTGDWWRREFRGLYAPALERTPDGRIIVSEWPQGLVPPP
jgi:lipase maturation factor 1